MEVENINQLENADVEKQQNHMPIYLSPFFYLPIWMRFNFLERELNERLKVVTPPANITHIYNPVEYAEQLHCQYLNKYLTGCKPVLFVGMNPGPYGMGQTGVPFGNISTVRDVMGLSGELQNLPVMHYKRPIKGLLCHREETSGVRLWTLLQKYSNNSLALFFQQCFVHNFCPLLFFDQNSKNITPSELKGSYKRFIRDECLRTLEAIFYMVQPVIIISIGDFVYQCLKKSEYCKNKTILKLAHPSPRAVGNSAMWAEKGKQFFEENDLLKYLRNEI